VAPPEPRKAELAPLAVERVEAPLPALSNPEAAIAARVPRSAPDRPFPSTRRAIFFDVENTSRSQHIARVIDHLAIDRVGSQTEFFAVGNWRVIGHDTARLLARHGAHLVHSAPSVGVRDWSDLRIAVAAGVWLAAARPGDSLELVSDDRAFDAVGDVASSLGIVFRRLSYRGLAGAPVEDLPQQEPEATREPSRSGDGSRRRRRGGRYRDRRSAPPPHGGGRPAPAPRHVPAARPAPVVEPPAETDEAIPAPVGEPHTAPQDEIVTVVSELMHSGRGVTIDTLANALKARGFRRTPGSPRLITRLRRIRDLSVDRNGNITLVGDSDRAPRRAHEAPVEVPPPEERDQSGVEAPLEEMSEPEGQEAVAAVPPAADVSESGRDVSDVTDDEDDDAPGIGNERYPAQHVASRVPSDNAGRRRSRRGGRRHRRRREGSGSGQPV
jgi:hypothetical protein